VLPLAFESIEVARARVLGLGPQVEVLSPAELRERVARRASAVAAVYQSASPPAPAPAGRGWAELKSVEGHSARVIDGSTVR
jgi:hypothetical protein